MHLSRRVVSAGALFTLDLTLLAQGSFSLVKVMLGDDVSDVSKGLDEPVVLLALAVEQAALLSKSRRDAGITTKCLFYLQKVGNLNDVRMIFLRLTLDTSGSMLSAAQNLARMRWLMCII